MHRVKNNTIPSLFHQKFQIIDHIYRTRNSQNNFVQSMIKINQTKNAISALGPTLWNNILNENLKCLTSSELLKRKVKDLLHSIENKIQFF